MTVKISEMTSATEPLSGVEQVEVVQGGNTRKTTVNKLSPDTLARLNTQISDATLDDASSPRTPTTHDLAGAEHGTSTLAELNSKVSDATLIDTGDSRLRDDRDPTLHALAGADHSADTLANLNSKVSDATLARTDAAQTFTGAQKTGVTALTDAATINLDASLNKGFSVTLGGNRTLSNPTNVAANDSWVLYVTQDATAGRTLTFDSNYVGPGTIADLSGDTNGQIRIFSFIAISPTKIAVVDSMGEAV